MKSLKSCPCHLVAEMQENCVCYASKIEIKIDLLAPGAARAAREFGHGNVVDGPYRFIQLEGNFDKC